MCGAANAVPGRSSRQHKQNRRIKESMAGSLSSLPSADLPSEALCGFAEHGCAASTAQAGSRSPHPFLLPASLRPRRFTWARGRCWIFSFIHRRCFRAQQQDHHRVIHKQYEDDQAA